MKDFNRGKFPWSPWLKAPRANSHGSHALTHTLYINTVVTTTWFEAPAQLLFFSVSVIHRTLTWTTGYLTCVRDHSCACVYTCGLGTPTANQHNILTRKNSQIFYCFWPFLNIPVQTIILYVQLQEKQIIRTVHRIIKVNQNVCWHGGLNVVPQWGENPSKCRDKLMVGFSPDCRGQTIAR